MMVLISLEIVLAFKNHPFAMKHSNGIITVIILNFMQSWTVNNVSDVRYY